MARASTMPFHRFFGDYRDLGLQTKNCQFHFAVLILAWIQESLLRHAHMTPALRLVCDYLSSRITQRPQYHVCKNGYHLHEFSRNASFSLFVFTGPGSLRSG